MGAAVRTLCEDPQAIQIWSAGPPLSPSVLSQDILHAAAVVRVCGFVALSGVFDEQLTERLKQQAASEFTKFEEHSKESSSQAARRSEGRFEIKFALAGAATEENTVNNRLLTAVVRATLESDRLEMDTLSHVTSLPGSPLQHWHRDTDGSLHKRTLRGASSMPPHCLVAAVPLVPLTQQSGPTQFLAGSHLRCEQRSAIKVSDSSGVWTSGTGECAHTVRTPWTAAAAAGSVVLFDSRILHRGGANHGSHNRPLLYMSYAREWFVDRVNFRDRQSSLFDGWPPTTRKMLSRLDAREYVATLESALAARGVDITQLQSVADYQPHTMSAKV